MYKYQSLSTEKYWQAAVAQEIKELRKLKRKEAFESFKMFGFAIFFATFVAFAIFTLPTWLPAVVEFMEYYGVIPPQYNV